MLRRLFPYLKRPDVEIFLDCASFIFFSVAFLHWVAILISEQLSAEACRMR